MIATFGIAKLGDICAIACAEAFRHDGQKLVSPMGPIPKLGAKLAQATFAPDIVLTDGAATIVDIDGRPEAWMPYSRVFDTAWNGQRHVMMGATQLDRHGNQNISALGDWKQPKVQLLGVRGSPGNTVYHPTSYFVAKHSQRVFVEAVDMVSGVGTDRGAFEIRCVVSNLGVFDFESEDGSMRLRALHPGVSVDDVAAATGFNVHIAPDVTTSRVPTSEEAQWLDRLDPDHIIRGGI
jgi:acyl CoA:acetate/3-ketoacid CoA transferase beta subunit